jgi:hypothetical protein
MRCVKAVIMCDMGQLILSSHHVLGAVHDPSCKTGVALCESLHFDVP